MTDSRGKRIEALTINQYVQLVRTSKLVQPYLPFKEVAFLELVKISAKAILNASGTLQGLGGDLSRFKRKFYPYGFKPNGRPLTEEQHKVLERYYYPRMTFTPIFTPYNPIEREAFVMVVRACKRYMLSGMDDEAEKVLKERLSQIADIIR